VIIPSDLWNDKNQRIIINCDNYQELQLKIYSKVTELHRRIRKLIVIEIEVTLDNLLETNGRKINCTIGSAWMLRFLVLKVWVNMATYIILFIRHSEIVE
jgi:hypothetical protein